MDIYQRFHNFSFYRMEMKAVRPITFFPAINIPVYESTGVLFVVYPMTPTFSPPTSRTVDGASSGSISGSSDAFMLALRTGNVTFFMKGMTPET